MGAASKIEWTDHTFNPWIGCMEVSPACDHCYARTLAARHHWAQWGAGEPRKRTSPGNWDKPRIWNAQAAAFRETNGHWPRVFCASLADIFDKDVPQSWRDDLFAVIRATPNLRWQLLTKRIGNAARMLPPDWPENFGHVGLMATIANQPEVDRDIPKLLSIPAAWHGLSCEPLLGALDVLPYLFIYTHADDAALTGDGPAPELPFHDPATTDPADIATPRVDWIIAGGESGNKARPCHPDWLRSLRDQCADACVPFFFKQWGEWAEIKESIEQIYKRGDNRQIHVLQSTDPVLSRHAASGPVMQRVGKKAAGRMLDGRTHDEFPNMERAAA